MVLFMSTSRSSSQRKLTDKKFKHQGMDCYTRMVKHLALPRGGDFIAKENVQEVICVGVHVWNDFAQTRE
jgi:hypothetical protein